MTLDMILGILLAGVLSNNYALLNFMGTAAVIENRRPVSKSLLIGLASTLVMVLATAITWPLNQYVLVSVPFMQTMAFVVVVLVVVELIRIFDKSATHIFGKVDFQKLAICNTVLGLCIRNTQVGFIEALITALAVGIGFMLTMTLYGILHRRLDEDAVPCAFQGLPIDLLLAGMIALAMMALA